MLESTEPVRKKVRENLNKFIYVDNAATTSLSKKALSDMLPFYEECFGNPSSICTPGTIAKKAVEEAREIVAKCLNAEPSEIFFTSGGTESDNWAIKGTVKRLREKGKTEIITSKFEHHAVLHTVNALEREGFTTKFLDVNENGIINPEDLDKLITNNTALVSVMYANNEIGTIQPIKTLGEVCKNKGVLFHTDAVQAVGHIPLDVKENNLDMMSVSGHKFHGPKGIGVLFVKKGTELINLLEGGAQESNRRAGTENVSGIVGLASALEESVKNLKQNYKNVKNMRDILLKKLLSSVDAIRLNGDLEKRLPGNINVSIAGIEGESLLLLLNEHGICASSGSACTSRSLDPSHVLLSIGLKHEIAHGSLRITLSEENTMEEINIIADVVPKVVSRLRAMSPLWDEMASSTGFIEKMNKEKEAVLSYL